MTGRDAMDRLIQSRDESAEVRSLLEAGIADDVADYDFEHGLSTHLAAVAAFPSSGGGPKGGAGPASASPSSTPAVSSKALALAIGVPAGTLAAIAAVVLLRAHAPASEEALGGAAPATKISIEAPATREARALDPSQGTDAPITAALPEVPARSPSAADPTSAASERRQPASRSVAAGRGEVRPERLVLSEDAPEGHHASAEGATNPEDKGIVRNFPDAQRKSPVGESSGVTAPPSAAGDDSRRSEKELARERLARDEVRRHADDQLQREMDELMRAKRALSNDPKLALELAERGQREFKQSLLTEEREHVLLLALIALGRASEAERLAAPYLARHPDSPFARRVRAALEAARNRQAR
jgi:hypothetical protein